MNQRRLHAFILLEVLVSLAILGVTLATVLRSFTVSLKAAKASRNVTIATILAGDLVEKWEVDPPKVGTINGDFAPDYPDFQYEAKYVQEKPKYKDVGRLQGVGRLNYMKRITVDVYYQPADSGSENRKLVLHAESALTSAEKYSAGARILNKIGFD